MKEIAAALIEAQKELPLVMAKKSKGHHSAYTSLEDLIERVRPILVKHGIAVVQTGDLCEGQAFCRTRLIHTSGETIEGAWPLIEAKDAKLHPAQAMGQGWTYARRYSLAAILGIGTGDQDVDAIDPPAEAPEPQPQKQQSKKAESSRNMTNEELAHWKAKCARWSEELGGEYGIICTRLGCNPDEFIMTAEAKRFQAEVLKAKEILGL